MILFILITCLLDSVLIFKEKSYVDHLLFLLLFLGLFTLILASIFQSSSSDKFSVTKLLAVIMRFVCLFTHETFSIECWKKSGNFFGFTSTVCCDLNKSHHLVNEPIRCKSKTNYDIVMYVFPCLAPVTCIVFWLVCCILKWKLMFCSRFGEQPHI